jgi:hypothetical protein
VLIKFKLALIQSFHKSNHTNLSNTIVLAAVDDDWI